MPYAPDDFWGGAGMDPNGGGINYGGGGGGYEGGSGVQGMGFFGNDPMAYTGGSWLTPWTQPFSAPPGSAGGASGIDMNPFGYGDFSYGYRPPSAYEGQQDITPDSFGYGEFQSPEQFKAPTAEDMTQDPSYQLRLKEGQNALLARGTASGLARTGGFAKGMADYNQEQASKEYGNVYARKKGEYDTTNALARQDWNTRFGNAKDVNETNASRKFNAAQANQQNRLAGYQASTDANIRGNELGYNIATGSYDRNRQNAKDAYDSAMQIAQSRASAGASNADQAYSRALNEYKMNYDIFQNNQGNQFDRTMQLMQFGAGAAGQQAGYGSEYAGNMGNTYGQQANAQAAGRVGSTQALTSGYSGAANTMLDAYMANQAMSNGQPAPARTQPTGSFSGYSNFGAKTGAGAQGVQSFYRPPTAQMPIQTRALNVPLFSTYGG